MEYYPCYQNQKPAWHEIVVFQKSQALPCFIIELSEDLVHDLYTNYSFTSCYAACQAGDLNQVEAWIQEDRKRLREENEQGENFIFAALLGSQLHILKWLYTQDPSLLKKCRKDGWTLMHVAAAKGHASIVEWLHQVDPLMIQIGQLTPLHVAAYCEQTDVLQLFLKEILADTPLIEEIVQRCCPKTLTYLLENGLDPNRTNSFKQTLLHLAAYKGQVAHLAILIEKGAPINAQDLSKKTPLYLANVQGHLQSVVFLLEQGADPTLRGMEGDTVLHVAAFYGCTPLLKILLHNPQVKQLLACGDEDGKQPIHKAVWGHAKPDTVQLLLENGANPKAINAFGYTPLHWAAEHGHIASAELLIKAGARTDAVNSNHDLPFDLAIRRGQDDFVHFFLGTKQKVKEEKLPQDVEFHYQKQLLQAKRENLNEEQVFYLEKLSNLYAQKQNWVQAAKLLNSALAILEKNLDNAPFQTYLLSRLERIEALFLESKGLKTSSYCIGSVRNYRTWLKNIRTLYVEQHQKNVPIQEITTFLTNSYRKLLGSLILNSQELLGPPLTKWACVGMGSMARGEMCPYSDLEFAFLIDEKTENSLNYFRTLAQLLELRIINLGESKFPIFAQLFGEKSMAASPTPGGFSIDSGGNTPLGKPGFYELIDTPSGLSQYQCIKWMDADIIVTNALSTTCHVAGDEILVSAYHSAKKHALDKTEGGFSLKKTPFRKKLALKLLQGNLHEFKPDLSKEKQETNAFGIKKELYRPLQSLIGNLALFCGLEVTSTFGMIQGLLQKGIFCSKGAENLTNTLKQILALRFEAHTFYQNEEEFLLHIEQGIPQDPHYLYLDEEHLKILHDIYIVLIPLQRCGEKFFETQDVGIFAKATFYDDSPSVQGAVFIMTLQYAKAQEAFQNGVSLNPNDVDAQLYLGGIEEKIGKSKDALPRCLKALELAKEKYGENHSDVAACHNNIGFAYGSLGDYDKALKCHQKALKIQLQVLGGNHPSVATSYSNIGTVHSSLGDYNKALECYRKALKISLEVLGGNHPTVGISYSNIGSVYDCLGDDDKALECYQKALKIWLQAYRKNHPNIEIIMKSLIACAEKASSSQVKTLRELSVLCTQILGAEHPIAQQLSQLVKGGKK